MIAFGIGSCPPRPTPQPTPKPCSFLSHRHGATGPCHYTLRKCNGVWIDHDADCHVVQSMPTPKPCSKHTHGLASHCSTQDHTTAEPDCTSSNGGQRVTWITAHYNQQSKTCPVVCAEHTHGLASHCTAQDHTTAEPDCTSSNGGQRVTWITAHYNEQSKTCPAACFFDFKTHHRHNSTNTCHTDHAACDSGKYKDETGTVYGSTGGDSHGYISVPGCNDRPTTTPGLICPTGQYVTTLNPIWIVQTSNGPRHVTQEQVRQYPTIAINGELADWERVSSNCYKPVLPEATQIKINLGEIISTVTDPIATAWNVSKNEVVAAWTYVDDFLYVTLCQPFVGTGLGVTAGKVAQDIKNLASKSGPIGIGVGVSIEGACEFEDWQRGRSSDQSSAQSSDQSSAGAVRPVGLVLVAGDGEIAVSWTASATVPADGFGYRVQWKLVTQAWGDAAVGSEDLDHGSDLATSHTVTGLVNGSAYDVRVAAFNADGVSDWITGQTTPAKPKPEAEPSLAFDSVSCESSGSGWVITVTWSKTPETLNPDIWANEVKNYGHRGRQTAVAGTSTTFDVPNAGWYQVGMQAKIAGNKKVGDNKAVRCR